MRGLIARTGVPSIATRPAAGAKRPEIMLSSVDLPHPLGPTIARNSPALTSRLTSDRTDTERPSMSNACERFSTVIFGVTIGADVPRPRGRYHIGIEAAIDGGRMSSDEVQVARD